MFPALLALLAATPALHCPQGFEPVGTQACLAAPRPFTNPNKLVVYFHGMLAANADWAVTAEFKLLGAEARQRGYALVAFRGEQGLCYWGKDLRDFFCWPSDKSQLVEVGRTLKRLEGVLTKVSERLGSRLGPPLLAGFSNGGFFVSLLVTESKFDARGYAVMHAGGVTGQRFAPDAAKPTILLGARADAIQLPTMRRLEQTLADAGWNPTFNLREGTHEVTAVDARALFEFFDSLNP